MREPAAQLDPALPISRAFDLWLLRIVGVDERYASAGDRCRPRFIDDLEAEGSIGRTDEVGLGGNSSPTMIPVKRNASNPRNRYLGRVNVSRGDPMARTPAAQV